MKRYRIVVPLLLLAAGVWVTVLSPNPTQRYLDFREANITPDPLLEQSNRMENDVIAPLRRVQISDWIDEFSLKTVNAHAAGEEFYLEQVAFEKPADLSRFTARLSGMTEGMPGDVAIGLVSVDRRAFRQLFPDFTPTMEMTDLVAAGVRDGQQYCVVIRTEEPNADERVGRGLEYSLSTNALNYPPDPEFRLAMLRQCYWIGRYGLPGAGMSEWLERFGFALGSSALPGSTVTIANMFDNYFANGNAREQWLFRLTSGRWEEEAGQRCRYDRDYCDSNWTLESAGSGFKIGYAEGLAQIVVDARLNNMVRLANPEMDRLVFSGLEGEFGPEAFEKFWTSDLEPMAAFEAAFGLSPLDWSHDRVVAVLGLSRAGPAPSPVSIFYGLVFGLIGILGGVLFGSRRQTA